MHVLIKLCLLVIFVAPRLLAYPNPYFLRTILSYEGECKEELKNEKSVLRRILVEKKPLAGRDEKCLARCILDKSELISWDGEQFINVADKVERPNTKSSRSSMVSLAVDHCLVKVKVTSDECEYGVGFLTCLFDFYLDSVSEK